MPSIDIDNLSSFGRLAVKLDTAFSELTRLNGQLQRLDIDSESGLERGVKILEQFSGLGENIASGMRDFSGALKEAHDQSNTAAKEVSERAQLIHGRKQEQNQIREKLNRIEEQVRKANTDLAAFKKEGPAAYSDEEKLQLKDRLGALNIDLQKFLTDAQGIKEAASQSKFKSIEQDAQALLDALRASRRKIEKVI